MRQPIRLQEALAASRVPEIQVPTLGEGETYDDLLADRASFEDFDTLLARTIEYNPTRTVASLRRGILHNALQRDDGSWVWRYARLRSAENSDGHPNFESLWAVVSAMKQPPIPWGATS